MHSALEYEYFVSEMSRIIISGAEAEAFFKIITSSQSRRLDDQRVALPTLPGISGNSEGKVEIQRHTTAEIPVSYTTSKLLVL